MSFFWRKKNDHTASLAGSDATSPTSSSNEELAQLLKEGRLTVSEMEHLRYQIVGPEVRSHLAAIIDYSREILQYIQNDLSYNRVQRQFLNYYLPTTLKLIRTYEQMSSRGLSGENITDTLTSIEATFANLVGVYEKQLDALFTGQALDIEIETKVMESLIDEKGNQEKKTRI